MMRKFMNILRKEMLQLMRTPVLVGLLIICPVITIGLVPFGLENKVSLKVAVVDSSLSARGKQTLKDLAAAPEITASLLYSLPEARGQLDRGEIDAIVLIPQDKRSAELIIDGVHLIHAQDIAFYVGRRLQTEMGAEVEGIRTHRLFSRRNDNIHYFIVAMLALLVAIIGCFLVALSVIGEKDSRMLEHLRSVGLKAPMYVLSKVVFFTLVSLAELAVGILIARLVFDFRVAGPLADFFLLGACFLFAVINIGILIAGLSKTLFQTVYISVFLFIFLILLSTMFAPLDNMSPTWAATRYVNPFFWMVDGGWKVALRGFGMAYSPENYLALLGIGGTLYVLNIFSIKRLD